MRFISLSFLLTGLAAAVTAAAEIGFSLAAHPSHAAAAAPATDPTPLQWQQLKDQIAAGLAGLHC